MRIDELFNVIAKSNYENVALESDDEGKMTYEELNKLSDNVAANLNDVKNGVIAVYVEKSFNMIISIMGILKSGNAYLPLDITYPQDRIEYMISDANVAKIICSSKTRDQLKHSEKIVLIDELLTESAETINDTSEDAINNASDSDLAYILYTSGSTGKPKGVEIEHNSIMNTIQWRIKYYGLSSEDKVLQIPSISFDSSVEDIFSTLLSGGTLVMYSEDKKLDVKYLAKQIKEKSVTHFLTVPSFYTVLLEALSDDTQMRFVVIAGESFTSELVKKHYKKLESVGLYNEYGPTENSVCSTVYRLNSDEDNVYIGNMIDNVDYIIDEKDEDGIGELWLTGKGLARGYHDDSQLTEERFVIKEGNRYYKTGDLVKESENGVLQFCGRKDQQIKLNGMRFDLNEIDNYIQKDSSIIDSKTAITDNKQIVTFLKSADIQNSDEIRSRLEDHIPKQFIPVKIYQVEEFLKLPNGKVDINRMIDEQENIVVNSAINFGETSDESNEDDIYAKIRELINSEFGSQLTEKDNEQDLMESGVLTSIRLIKLMVALEETFECEIDFDDFTNYKQVSIVKLGQLLSPMEEAAS
ncbi:MAG: non-ribosomal peptide synthetase [Lachnospiraceae bacterium]|nr:non-ribosomal peptide synthetase [Lachnospiraceae bacterium]